MFKKVAHNLNVALGTVHNVYRCFQLTGELDQTKPDRSSTRKLLCLQELSLVGLLLDNLGLYLGEACQRNANITSCRFLLLLYVEYRH